MSRRRMRVRRTEEHATKAAVSKSTPKAASKAKPKAATKTAAATETVKKSEKAAGLGSSLASRLKFSKAAKKTTTSE